MSALQVKHPAVFIGMPVYRGEMFLDETLRSVRNQEFEDFNLLISVDGNDEKSVAACAPHLEDPRISLVRHTGQLGWAANLNWLMTQSKGDYFQYWQQDDLCSTNFLRVLYEHASQHSEASCCYADLQWFGSQVGRWHSPSVTGSGLERVLSLVENGYAGFMGIVRNSALQAAGPIRINCYDSRLEDFIWAVKLAREGELHYVPEALYFKRAHASNTHSFSPCPDGWLPGMWREYGLGLLEAGLPLVAGADRTALLFRVLERLVISRPGRWRSYEPSGTGFEGLTHFANGFLDEARRRFDVKEWDCIARLPSPKTVIAIAHAHGSSFGATAPDGVLLEIALRQLGQDSINATVPELEGGASDIEAAAMAGLLELLGLAGHHRVLEIGSDSRVLFDECAYVGVDRNLQIVRERCSGEQFDFILAQSLFTGSGPEEIEQWMQTIGPLLSAEGALITTFVVVHGDGNGTPRIYSWLVPHVLEILKAQASRFGLTFNSSAVVNQNQIWIVFGGPHFVHEGGPCMHAWLNSGVIAMRDPRTQRFRTSLRQTGRFEARFAARQPGVALLDNGWSMPEGWGVWSDGPIARLRLPVIGAAQWRLAISGYCFAEGLAGDEEGSVIVRCQGLPVAHWPFTREQRTIKNDVLLDGGAESDVLIVEFEFPNAASPMELGRNDDARRLGLALEGLTLERN